MTVSVVVVDDDLDFRREVIGLLENEPGIEVVAEAADGRSAVFLAKDMRPDVIILDVLMPEMNCIEATARIAAEAPGTKVIFTALSYDRMFVEYVLRTGACGLVVRDRVSEELVEAIRDVMDGRSYTGAGMESSPGTK